MSRRRRLDPAARFINASLRELLKHTYDFPVTFIGAPPGYGKTVAVDSLKDDQDTFRINIHFDDAGYVLKQIAWFFAGRYDELAEMMLAVEDWKGFLLDKDSAADAHAEIYTAIDLAMQQLGDRGRQIRIIIEDMHVLDCADELARLLVRMAAASGRRIHFVLTSRTGYWDRLSSDVVKGDVCLIPPETLLLAENEISEYFSACGLKLERKDVLYLHRQTDGWIMILSMIINEYIRSGHRLKPDEIELDDYMKSLVEKGSPVTEAELAGELCLLDAFTAEQAERFTGRANVRELIAAMRRFNIYIMHEPAENTYRFAAPYRRYLFKGCYGNDSSLLKKRLHDAGDIMLEDGAFVRAADYYHRAEDYEMMMTAIERGRHIGSDGEKRENYIRYYRDCPRDIRSRHHLAMLYMAWRFFNFGELELYRDASLEFLADLYADKNLSEKEKNSLLCDYSLFCAMTDFEDLEKVRQDYDNALSVFDGVMRTDHSVIPRTFGTTAVMKLFYNKGTIENTLNLLNEVTERGKKLIGGGWAGISYEAEAEAAFMRLDFDMAEIMMDCAERECEDELSAGVWLCIAFLRTRLAIARGLYTPESDPMAELLEREKKIMAGSLRKTAELCTAWISIQTDNGKNVEEWIKTGDFSEVDLLYPAMPSIYLMHMYVLFSMKKYNRLLSYSGLFFGRESITGNLLIKESACLIIASAWNEIGKTYNAREYLCRAFDLVLETGNLSSVIFYGESLLPLMRQLPEKYKEAADRSAAAVQNYIKNRERCREAVRGSHLKDLTLRETQVASCAASGMINREIGEKLGISENTVKTTMQRIFSKLELTSRRQLAERLKELSGE